MDVHDHETWPPGSMMLLRGQREFSTFMGLGLVVQNDRFFVSVLWDSGCKQQYCTYPIGSLNERVIHRVP